jgi:hypothetical protein
VGPRLRGGVPRLRFRNPRLHLENPRLRMKKPRLRRKKSNAEPKLDRELRPHLLYAMMQALAIVDMAEPRTLKRLERVEKDCAGLAQRSSGAAQMLAKCTAKLARQYIDSLKMAGESADAICKCLGKMAR